jgi:catechol-2,3-dioxygenase
MFKQTKAFSGFSVDDIQKAKKFYQEILELEVTEEAMGILTLRIRRPLLRSLISRSQMLRKLWTSSPAAGYNLSSTILVR